MRTRFLAAMTAVLLLGGTAFAQSQQGGYLGNDVGAGQSSGAARVQGSQQGGYLGMNPGAHQESARAPQEDMQASPTAWCAYSTDPSRCAGRAATEHQLCASKQGEAYARCRAAMHQMYTH